MSDWKDVGKSLAGNGLKLLGTVLGGPLGAKVGGMVAGALGLESDSPDAVENAIAQDPQALVKLRELEMQHKTELRKLQLEEIRLQLGDVQNARDREIKITASTGERDINLYLLAWLVVLGFFVLVSFMYFISLPEKNIGPINQLFGAMATGFGMVLQYFFGSSKSSKDKDKVIAAGKGQ